MDREPSIHITKSIFIRLTKELGIKLSKPNIDRLMRAARELSCDNRTMVANTKREEKTIRRSEGSIGDANLAAHIIYSCRIKMKHVGVTKIKQTDQTWGQIRQLTTVLNQFCDNHDLEKRAGYIAFIELGLKMMTKAKRPNFNFAASWMVQKASYIDSRYTAEESIRNDPYPQNTREIMSIYQSKVSEMTGMYVDYTQNPSEYVYFIQARELADKYNMDYYAFISAQFAALSFCNGIPNLRDLGNDKAEQRLAQFIAKNGIQVKRAALSEDTWKQFK